MKVQNGLKKVNVNNKQLLSELNKLGRGWKKVYQNGYLHFEMIKKALAAGKEVVTEKPVTRTREEFEALLQLERAAGVCVVLQNRLNPCVQRLKEMVQSGELGAVKWARGVLT